MEQQGIPYSLLVFIFVPILAVMTFIGFIMSLIF